MSCYLYSFKGKGCVQMDDTDRKYPILHWILVPKHKMYASMTSKIKLVEIEYGYEHVAVKNSSLAFIKTAGIEVFTFLQELWMLL